MLMNKRGSAPPSGMNSGILAAAATVAAPEAAPVIGAAGAAAGASEQKKLAKKEEKVADKELQALRGGSQRAGTNSAGVTLIIILAIALHIIEIFSNFPRPPTTVIWTGYAILALFAFFTIGSMSLDKEMGALLVSIVLAILLPVGFNALANSLQSQWMVTTNIILELIPPVVIFLFMQYPEHSLGNKIIKLYLFALSVLAIVILLATPMAQQATSSSAPMTRNLGASWTIFVTTAENSFTKLGQGFGNQWNGWIQQAECPDCAATQESQKGIYLDNVQPGESTFYTSSTVFVEGALRAQDLTDNIQVNTQCTIPDKGLQGSASPKTISMTGNDWTTVDCNFGQLTKGIYNAKIISTFDYLTEAKIQYYFVDMTLAPAVYANANIPSQTMATYTGGPVTFGLLAQPQPIRINANGVSSERSFALKLQNQWTQGNIARGNKYEIDVPAAIELVNCTRTVSGYVKNGDRTVYTFQMDQSNLREKYDSLSCRMKIDDPASLIGNPANPPATTFIARAYYTYALEGTATISVN